MVTKKLDELYKNEKIPFQEFLVITNDGQNLGIMRKSDAIAKAANMGFDLICISPEGKKPVCKMFIYDHYRYEIQQKEKQQKKLQREKIMREKEITLGVNIDVHDLETKAKRARTFLVKGNKVTIALRYRGREIQHAEFGIEKVKKLCELLSDVSTLDREFEKYRREGNMFRVYLIPKKRTNAEKIGGENNAKNED